MVELLLAIRDRTPAEEPPPDPPREEHAAAEKNSVEKPWRERPQREKPPLQEVLRQAPAVIVEQVEAWIQLDIARTERAAALGQANRQIDKSMTQVRRIAADFARQMQNAPKPWTQTADQFLQQIELTAQSTTLAQRRAEFVESVRTGDRVSVTPFKRSGIVQRIRRKRRIMTVLLDGKQIEVPFTQIIEPPED